MLSYLNLNKHFNCTTSWRQKDTFFTLMHLIFNMLRLSLLHLCVLVMWFSKILNKSQAASYCDIETWTRIWSKIGEPTLLSVSKITLSIVKFVTAMPVLSFGMRIHLEKCLNTDCLPTFISSSSPWKTNMQVHLQVLLRSQLQWQEYVLTRILYFLYTDISSRN